MTISEVGLFLVGAMMGVLLMMDTIPIPSEPCPAPTVEDICALYITDADVELRAPQMCLELWGHGPDLEMHP